MKDNTEKYWIVAIIVIVGSLIVFSALAGTHAREIRHKERMALIERMTPDQAAAVLQAEEAE